MFWTKECVVCNKRFNSIFDENYVKVYNDAKIKLHGALTPVTENAFVCQECAYESAMTVCPGCNERSDRYSFIDVHIFSPTVFDDRALNQSKARVKELETRVSQLSHGRKPFPYSNAIYVCDMCRERLLKEVLSEFMEELKQKHGQESSQPILLFNNVPNDKTHCLRCGMPVSNETNYAEHLKLLYSDDCYPYDDYKDECKSVLHKYLNAEALCPACCWQLRPAHVREDYIFREREGWIEGTEKSLNELGDGRYAEIHRFDLISNKIKLEESQFNVTDRERRERAKRQLKDAMSWDARRVGANSFILFSYSMDDYESEGRYSGIPVLVRRNESIQNGAKSNESNVVLPKKVIIDGSNIIRFKDGGSVKGLSATISALSDKGCQACVFLDANILHVLEDGGEVAEKVLLEELLAKSPDTVKMVPAGARADDFILLRADCDESHILSNDRYEQYMDQYPWLKGDRLHKFMFMNEHLMIPDFGIYVKVN